VFLFLTFVTVEGDSYPKSCAQRTAEGDESLMFFRQLAAGAAAGFLRLSIYPLGMDGLLNENKSIYQFTGATSLLS